MIGRIILSVLAALFPPKLGYVESFNDPDTGYADDSGILWRAYDVRRTGIEKMMG